MPSSENLTHDTAATYIIRIQGYLDQRWADSIGAVDLRVDSQPDAGRVTVITGRYQDQAALTGALNFLYDLGLPLLSVECIAVEPDEPA